MRRWEPAVTQLVCELHLYPISVGLQSALVCIWILAGNSGKHMNIHLNQKKKKKKKSLFFLFVFVLLLKTLLNYDSTSTAIRKHSLLEPRSVTFRCSLEGLAACEWIKFNFILTSAWLRVAVRPYITTTWKALSKSVTADSLECTRSLLAGSSLHSHCFNTTLLTHSLYPVFSIANNSQRNA